MKVRVSQDSQGSVAVLAGDVDESVTDGLRVIAAEAKAAAVIFDCDAVQNINSIGIRQWMLFMATFAAQHKITYRRCPPALVDYALMIPRVFGAGRVESLYLSYYCEPCAESSKVLFEFAPLKVDAKLAISRCVKCASELETDMDLDAIRHQFSS